MVITAHLIILVSTVIVSMNAMNDLSLKDRMMYVPYLCKKDHQYYRIFTHLFIHADVPHLMFNMMSFYFLGKDLEEDLIGRFGFINGEVYFVLLYFLGGLFATLIPYMRHQDNPSYRSLGASGAVSAVIYAFVVWNPFVWLNVMFIPMQAWVFGLVYLAYEFYADKKGNSAIAHDAHIGGAIFGVLYILIIDIEKIKQILNLDF
jgi:membrane associated rhomboid family serine protease